MRQTLAKALGNKKRWLMQIIKLPFILLFPAALAIKQVFRADKGFAELYMDRIYPALSVFVNRLWSFTRASASEIILIALGLFLAGLCVYTLVMCIKRKDYIIRVCAYILTLAAVGGALYFSFISFWGLNYERTRLADVLGLHVRESTQGELVDLCALLVGDANTLRQRVNDDETGVFALQEDYPALLQKVPGAYMQASTALGAFAYRGYSPPKEILNSWYMCRTQTTGIFLPFTMEANVNMLDVPLLFPATACHEYAHLYGYAREDEANFISYIICINSGDDEFMYSGTMLAMIHCMNRLYKENESAYFELYDKIDESVKDDLKAYNAFWAQYKGKLAEASNAANDSYLKAMGQEDGVKSYGRMIDLLLAYVNKGADNE